jgi:hypothetical protein
MLASANAAYNRAMFEARKAQASAGLEGFRADIEKAVPEFEDWVRQDPAARVGKPFPMIANLIAHIEGRSIGITLDPKSPFAPVADAIRDEMEHLRTTIETEHPDILEPAGTVYDPAVFSPAVPPLHLYRHTADSPRKTN